MKTTPFWIGVTMVSLVHGAAAAEPLRDPHGDCPFLRPMLKCPPQGRPVPPAVTP